MHGSSNKVFLLTKIDSRSKQKATRQLDESPKRLKTDKRLRTNDYFISTTTSSIGLPVSLTSLCIAPAGIGSCQ